MKKALAYTVALLGLGCGDGTDALTGANGTSDPTTGTIHVSLVMSGGDMDADGCTVAVDSSSQHVNTGASVAFSHLSAGTHVVSIGDVATNCQVDGSASRSVTVVAGQTAQTSFAVACDWRTRIAFLGGPGYHKDIFVMNPDGTGQIRLTNDDLDDIAPIWSPDGTKIAFERGDEGGKDAGPYYDIFVMNPDGTEQVQLTNHSDIHYPAWSRDGSQIAYMCGREYCVMNRDGTGQVQLTNHSDADRRAAWQPVSWSPDGTRIAFSSEEEIDYNRNYDIYAVNADGTEEVRLTNHPDTDISPAWSPNGESIAFVSRHYGDPSIYSIYLMNADGTDQVRLTYGSRSVGRPRWSPDGGQILFGRANDLFVVNADATGLINLINGRIYASAPTWSPDGTRIAFLCRPGYGICVMNADGTDQVQLISEERGCGWAECGPSWSPDLY